MTEKKPKKPPFKDAQGLTIKRRKFLTLWLEHGDGTAAAMEVYNCKDKKSAASMANEILTILDNGLIKDKMNAVGLTDEYLMSKLYEGLDAKKVEVAKFQGSIGGEKAYVDHATRKAYVELVLKWKGELKDHHIHEGAIPVEFTGDNAEEYIHSKTGD